MISINSFDPKLDRFKFEDCLKFIEIYEHFDKKDKLKERLTELKNQEILTFNITKEDKHKLSLKLRSLFTFNPRDSDDLKREIEFSNRNIEWYNSNKQKKKAIEEEINKIETELSIFNNVYSSVSYEDFKKLVIHISNDTTVRYKLISSVFEQYNEVFQTGKIVKLNVNKKINTIILSPKYDNRIIKGSDFLVIQIGSLFFIQKNLRTLEIYEPPDNSDSNSLSLKFNINTSLATTTRILYDYTGRLNLSEYKWLLEYSMRQNIAWQSLTFSNEIKKSILSYLGYGFSNEPTKIVKKIENILRSKIKFLISPLEFVTISLRKIAITVSEFIASQDLV